MVLGKLLDLSGPQFLYLWNRAVGRIKIIKYIDCPAKGLVQSKWDSKELLQVLWFWLPVSIRFISGLAMTSLILLLTSVDLGNQHSWHRVSQIDPLLPPQAAAFYLGQLVLIIYFWSRPSCREGRQIIIFLPTASHTLVFPTCQMWLLRQSEVDRWNNYLGSSANGKQNKKTKKENPTLNLAVEGDEFIGLNDSCCLRHWLHVPRDCSALPLA